MGKKRKNPLKIQVKPISLPRSVTPTRFFRGLIHALDTGQDLPRSWDVEISWRNPNTRSGRSRYWQTDDFNDAIADSSAGFSRLLRRMLVRRLRGVR